MKGFYFTFFVASCFSILWNNTKDVIWFGLFILFALSVYKKTGKRPIVFMFFCFVFFLFYKTNSPYFASKIYQEYEVKVQEAKENYCLVSDKKHMYLFYNNEVSYAKNDVLSFEANLTEIPKDSNLYGFEFKDFLKKKRVFYQFENVNNLKKIDSKISLSAKIKTNLTHNLKNETKKFVSMLLLNENNIDEIAYNNLLQINALHLFVVSGFHILFLNKLLNFVFSFFLKDKAFIFSLIVLCFYLFLLEFSISATRAFLCLLFSKLDMKKKGNSLDYLSISGIILLFIEPLTIFNLSFIMSYSLTFVLLLSKYIFKNKTIVQRAIYTSFISFLVMIPIQLSISYKINFVSFFSNILLSYAVMFLFLLAILSMILSFLSGNIFGFIYKLFFQSINQLANISRPLIFGNPSILFVLLFYVLLFLVLSSMEKNHYPSFIFGFSLMCGLIFINYYKNKLISYEQVTFLDVYQGDCAILESKWGEGVMLIDTGGLKNYDIASKKIIPYLEYKGIKAIDMVVISHDDYDHNGALSSLKKQFIVKKIITDPNIDKIELGSLSLKNLNRYHVNYTDKNNQSIVLYGKIANSKYLFTGDIDKEIEKLIIRDNQNLKVDILKVAHHGSNTSTCEEFICHIQPKFAVISVGKNQYGHPSKEVLEVLNQNHVKILRTDKRGSILFSYRYHFYYIETAK